MSLVCSKVLKLALGVNVSQLQWSTINMMVDTLETNHLMWPRSLLTDTVTYWYPPKGTHPDHNLLFWFSLPIFYERIHPGHNLLCILTHVHTFSCWTHTINLALLYNLTLHTYITSCLTQPYKLPPITQTGHLKILSTQWRTEFITFPCFEYSNVLRCMYSTRFNGCTVITSLGDKRKGIKRRTILILIIE